MNENKQKNPEIKQIFDGLNKKINRDACPAPKERNEFWCRVLKRIIIGLAIFIIVILIFGVGMFVGGTKARFSYRWAESYHKNFAGPRGGFFGDWQKNPPFPGDFIEGHGTFGEIIEIQDTSFVIKGQGELEKVIVITDGTLIQKGRETVKKENLKVGNKVVIIGSPNEQGQIEAKLIRIFDGEDIKNLPKNSRFPFF